jgi:hypothetical protein
MATRLGADTLRRERREHGRRRTVGDGSLFRWFINRRAKGASAARTRGLETGGRGLVGNPVMLWLLAAGRQLRTMVGSPTPVVEMRAIQDTGNVQPRDRVSFSAADGDHDSGKSDAVAGSEFVDDRIRELE